MENGKKIRKIVLFHPNQFAKKHELVRVTTQLNLDFRLPVTAIVI